MSKLLLAVALACGGPADPCEGLARGVEPVCLGPGDVVPWRGVLMPREGVDLANLGASVRDGGLVQPRAEAAPWGTETVLMAGGGSLILGIVIGALAAWRLQP